MHIQTSTAAHTIAFAAGIAALGALGGYQIDIREMHGSGELPAIGQSGTFGRDLPGEALDDWHCAFAANAVTLGACVHSRREPALPNAAHGTDSAAGPESGWAPFAVARSTAIDSQ